MLEPHNICPNCGYQVSEDDYYCPSCKHRIEFTSSSAEERVQTEPVTEMVQLSKALILSSILYAISVVLSTVESALGLIGSGIWVNAQSVAAMASIAMASVSALCLGAFMTAPARRLSRLHYPSLLVIMLGIANLLLVIGLASIFPFPSTLDNIVNGLANSANALALASQYSLFFVLAGFAGLFGIIGTIGLLLALHRSSRILRQPLVYYGMIAGIICTLIEVVTGLSIVLLLAPILIIIGARRSLEPDFNQF